MCCDVPDVEPVSSLYHFVGFVNDHSVELATLVLETLPSYSLKTQQRAVNQWVRSALAYDGFLKAFAGALIKACAVHQPPQNAIKLLEWTCLVLEQLPQGSGKAVQKLLEAQGSLFITLFSNSSDHAGHQRWQASQRIVSRLLRSNSSLYADYIQAAAASGNAGLVNATLSACLLQQGKQQQQQQQTAHAAVELLLPVLCDKLLAARETPKPLQLAAYAPLLSKALTPQQLTDKLVPAACKAMRRTPEPAITAFAGALQYVQLDISSVAPELVDVLLQQLRVKEAVRGVSRTAARRAR